jgi:hypothetical protein
METDPKEGATMIAITWVLWFVTQIFNVVILLNFLISYISTVYEDVYGSVGLFGEFESMAA